MVTLFLVYLRIIPPVRMGYESIAYEADGRIGQFGKYHNTLCLSPQILHKHCFQFLLELTMIPRENKNNAYAKFGGTNKEYYGIFRTGQWAIDSEVRRARGIIVLVKSN